MSNLIKIFGIFSISFVVALGAMLIYVSSYDYHYIKSIIEKAVFDATGRKLSINGDIYFHIGLYPGIRMSDLTFENASWSSNANMIKIGQLTLDIRLWPLLKKNVHIKRFILENLDIFIEKNALGESNFVLKKIPKKKSRQTASDKPFSIPEMGFHNICLKKVNLSYCSASDTTPVTMTFQQINAQTESLDQSINLDLMGIYHKHNVKANAIVGSIKHMLDSNKKWPVQLSAQGGGMDIEGDGYIQDVMSFKNMSFNLNCKGKQLKKFQEMMGTSMPINGPYHIQMAISEQSERQYKIASEMFLGQNKLKGLGELHLDRSLPGFKLVLEADTIDLRPFIEKKDSSSHSKSANHNDYVFSPKNIISNALFPIEFLSNIRIHRLITQRLDINRIDTQIHLTPDVLSIKRLKASIGGGTISGNFTIDNRQNKGEVTTAIVTDNINIGKILKEQDITGIFEGAPDINISLKSNGKSMHDWMSHLNGYAIVQMDKGKIYNRYINMLGGEFSSNVLRLINPMKINNYALVHCMASRLDIHDGFADITIFMVDSDQMRVLGAGSIDFGKETLNISLNPLPKSGLDTGRLGKYSLSLSQLAQPFTLGGTFKKPRLKMDLTKAAWTIGKALGGMMLFGPAGIAVSFISGVAEDSNPCQVAHEIARTGQYPENEYQKSFIEKTQDSLQKGMNDMGKTISETWKNIMD